MCAVSLWPKDAVSSVFVLLNFALVVHHCQTTRLYVFAFEFIVHSARNCVAV